MSGGRFIASGRLNARQHRAVSAERESRVFESLWQINRHCSRSHYAVIRVYDDAGNVIETHEHKGDFKEW